MSVKKLRMPNKSKDLPWYVAIFKKAGKKMDRERK